MVRYDRDAYLSCRAEVGSKGPATKVKGRAFWGRLGAAGSGLNSTYDYSSRRASALLGQRDETLGLGLVMAENTGFRSQFTPD